MIFEICSDSLETAKLAEELGAKRVELCSALSVGGLTPSVTLARECADLPNVEVHALLRLREGSFVYSEIEIMQMLGDMNLLAEAGVHGVVFGCLNQDYSLDMESNRQLIQEAKELNLEVTFHRAFDCIREPMKTLEELIELGFGRILTSGSRQTAIEGKDLIHELVQRSSGRIQIMAGGGVNATNAKALAKLGVDALHFTSHTLEEETALKGMGSKSLVDPSKFQSIKALFE